MTRSTTRPPQRPGRPRTRVDAQAETRELVLQAAEKAFLAKGLHATTVAEIAAAAGRTQGAIYGNFDGKEALCSAILQRRYERLFADLSARLDAGGESLTDKMEQLGQWWRANASDDSLTLLVAEFAVAARRDPQRHPLLLSAFAFVENAFSSMFAEHFKPADSGGNGPVDAATLAVLATGTGLAVVQAMSMSQPDLVTTVLSETLRFWVERVEAATSGAPDAQSR